MSASTPASIAVAPSAVAISIREKSVRDMELLGAVLLLSRLL